MATQATVALSQKAKQYSRIKYTLSITETVYTLILLLVFLSLGMAKILGQGLSGFLAHTWLVLPVYLLVISLLYYLLDFPFNFYHSYILEHRFSLSQQKISNWLADQLKSGIIAYF